MLDSHNCRETQRHRDKSTKLNALMRYVQRRQLQQSNKINLRCAVNCSRALALSSFGGLARLARHFAYNTPRPSLHLSCRLLAFFKGPSPLTERRRAAAREATRLAASEAWSRQPTGLMRLPKRRTSTQKALQQPDVLAKNYVEKTITASRSSFKLHTCS